MTEVNPKFWATVTILVAVIGCVGVIIAATIEILPDITKPETSITISPTEIIIVPSPNPATQATAAIEPTATTRQITQQPSATTVPTSAPTPKPQSSQVIWDESAVHTQTGYTSMGHSEAWMVFQVWDGQNLSSVTHGVVEPGWTVRIPSPLAGTMWTVSNIGRDSLIPRVIEMRQEVVARDEIPEPPLVYIGADSVPQGFTTQLPAGWDIQH